MARRANHKTKLAAAVWAAWCSLACGVAAVAILSAVILASRPAEAQQVVDRIVARVEGDVLLLSDLRELGQFQLLLGEKAESDAERMDELVDQWIIEHEAEAALFSTPSEADVAFELAQVKKEVGGEQAYLARLKELGLTEAAVRRLLRREVLLSQYLDYKFRPSAQVDADAEQKYYDGEFKSELLARGATVPPIDSVRLQIHELLVQKDISARSAEWLKESRSRLKIEMVPAAGSESKPQPPPEKKQPK